MKRTDGKLKKLKIIEYEQYRKVHQLDVLQIQLALSPPSLPPPPSSNTQSNNNNNRNNNNIDISNGGGGGGNNSNADLSQVKFKKMIASGCDGIVCVGTLTLPSSTHNNNSINNNGSGSNNNGSDGSNNDSSNNNEREGRGGKEIEIAIKVFPNYGVETKELGT